MVVIEIEQARSENPGSSIAFVQSKWIGWLACFYVYAKSRRLVSMFIYATCCCRRSINLVQRHTLCFHYREKESLKLARFEQTTQSLVETIRRPPPFGLVSQCIVRWHLSHCITFWRLRR
jgi:hypothetical protein